MERLFPWILGITKLELRNRCMTVSDPGANRRPSSKSTRRPSLEREPTERSITSRVALSFNPLPWSKASDAGRYRTVTEFRGRTLALLIQAVDSEIHRLRSLPEEQTVQEDEERLVAFENLADELADAYESALRRGSGLAPYELLVRHQS